MGVFAWLPSDFTADEVVFLPSVSRPKGSANQIGGRSYAFKAVLLELALEDAGLMPASPSDTPENEEAVEFALAVTRQLVE